jgi:hypothetical protein
VFHTEDSLSNHKKVASAFRHLNNVRHRNVALKPDQAMEDIKVASIEYHTFAER